MLVGSSPPHPPVTISKLTVTLRSVSVVMRAARRASAAALSPPHTRWKCALSSAVAPAGALVGAGRAAVPGGFSVHGLFRALQLAKHAWGG
eukprot:364856-Chlamydomonas_euryale.AAC.2